MDKKKIGLIDHDIGFKFLPSLVAQYKITGNERAKKAAIIAADEMLEHVCPVNHFIIRDGKGNDGDPLTWYRSLVDSMMNIPLFFWAHQETGDKKYLDAAVNHYRETVKYLIVGIGINTSKQQFSIDIKDIATSIIKEFDVNIGTQDFIAEFCNRFEKEINKRREV